MRRDFEEGFNMNTVDVRTRLVYLQPNSYSDEAIAVGVVYEASGRTSVERVGSSHHISILSQLYDDDFTEQVTFSLQLLDEQARDASFTLDSAQSPTELLRLGPPSYAVCENPDMYVRDLLRLSSSLFSKYRVVKIGNETVDQEGIERQLKESIVRINPLVGMTLVQSRKVETNKNRRIEIPLYGEKIIGASVSFSTSKPGGATNAGEALVARLNWAREALLSRENVIRCPVVYAYTPNRADPHQQSIIEDSVGELELIASASQVRIRSAGDVDSLAYRVYEDEAVSLQ
jgi:hypothetical protein